MFRKKKDFIRLVDYITIPLMHGGIKYIKEEREKQNARKMPLK